MYKMFKFSLLFIFCLFSPYFSASASADDVHLIVDDLKPWTITFSKPVLQASVADNIFIQDEAGQVIETTYEYMGNVVKVLPVQPYEADKLYTLTIQKGLQNEALQPLVAGTQYLFTLDAAKQELVSSFTINPGESVLIGQENDENVQIEITKFAPYDISIYGEYYTQSEIVKVESHPNHTHLLRKGEAVITNKGTSSLEVSSFSKPLKMSKTYESAIKREVVGHLETVQVTNSNVYRVAPQFDPYETNDSSETFNSVSYSKDTDNPSNTIHYQNNYGQIPYVLKDERLVVTNNGGTGYIYGPARYLTFVKSDEPALRVTPIDPDETYKITMNLNIKKEQDIYVVDEEETTYTYASYYQETSKNSVHISTSGFNQKAQDMRDKGRIRIGYLSSNDLLESYTYLQNSGNGKAYIITPYRHVFLEKINHPVFEQTTIHPYETVTVKPKFYDRTIEIVLAGDMASYTKTLYEYGKPEQYPWRGTLLKGQYAVYGGLRPLNPNGQINSDPYWTFENTSGEVIELYTTYGEATVN